MIVFQGVYTYTGHAGQPDWKRADRRDCLQCRCIHRPCADPRSQWRGRASVASPRLKEEEKKNKSGAPPHENRMKNATQYGQAERVEASRAAGAQEMTEPITRNQRAAK